MKRASSKRKRDSDSSSSSSEPQQASPQRPEQLFKDLKTSLIQKNTNNTHKIIYKLQKKYKQSFGILRISIPDTFSFNQNDMQQFFKKFGKIEKKLIKQNNGKVMSQDQPKNKQSVSLGYIIYREYCSAILAMKVLNSVPQKQRIFSAKICHSLPISSDAKLFCQPLIGYQNPQNMTIQIQKDCQFDNIQKNYKFVGTIGLDITDKQYKLKQRILGVKGCNFIRILYACQKKFKFDNQHQQSRLDDLVIKLIYNKFTGLQREVLVLSNCLQKYNEAIKNLHQLFQQIIQQYKNSKQKMVQIIPRDIHVRKWQKFQVDMTLKFLNS